MPAVAKKPAKVVAAPVKSPFEGKREVIYPTVKTLELVGKDALTITQIKEHIGWTEVTDAKESMLTDFLGNRVQLLYNQNNRPIDESWCRTLAQVILNHQWEWNHVPILISKYGNIVSGQHRMVGAVFAEQIRTHPDHKEFWKERGWRGPVTIDTTVVTGVPEEGDFTRTIDYTRPSSDGDVLYKDKTFFAGKLRSQQERAKLCTVAGHAIRKMWLRTGRKNDSNVSILTHSELVEFLRDHPSLQDAAVSIADANTNSKVSWYAGVGFATALLYLMAASTSDPAAYAEEHAEKALDLQRPMSTVGKVTETLLDRAAGYWVALATSDPRVAAVRKFIARRTEDAVKVGQIMTEDERVSAVIKGWNKFMGMPQTAKLTEADVRLSYTPDKEIPGGMHLEEYNRCNDGKGNGIDATSGKDAERPLSTEPEVGDPEPEEVAATAEEIREEVVQANGGSVVDESPEAERKRREELEAKAAAAPTNGTPVAKRTTPAPKPKSPSPEEANRAAVGRKPVPRPKPVAAS